MTETSRHVLVIQGAGMDRRGREHIEVFGPETLEEINAEILRQAQRLRINVDIIQHNDDAALIGELEALAAGQYDALIINPGGFTTTTGPLTVATERSAIPCYEVHASNPAARGVQSTLTPVCRGAICGFGYRGYQMALEAIANS